MAMKKNVCSTFTGRPTAGSLMSLANLADRRNILFFPSTFLAPSVFHFIPFGSWCPIFCFCDQIFWKRENYLFFLSWCFLEIGFSPHLLLPPVDLFSNCISSESSKDSPELRFRRICSELGKKISSTEGNEWDQWLEKNGRSLLYFVRNHFLTLWCWDFLSSLNFQRSTWLIPLCNQTYAWIVSAALLIEIDKIAFVVNVDSAPSIFSNIVGTLLIEFDLIEFEADVAPCIFGHLMVYWHLSAPLPSPRAERRSLAWK